MPAQKTHRYTWIAITAGGLVASVVIAAAIYALVLIVTTIATT